MILNFTALETLSVTDQQILAKALVRDLCFWELGPPLTSSSSQNSFSLWSVLKNAATTTNTNTSNWCDDVYVRQLYQGEEKTQPSVRNSRGAGRQGMEAIGKNGTEEMGMERISNLLNPDGNAENVTTTLAYVEAWKAATDAKTGRTYYYNAITRETQWFKPKELKELERRKRMEFLKQQKVFFDEMETNIMKSLARGELIPSVPLEKTEKEGPPREPLPPSRVRTISCMNEDLLAEIREEGCETVRPRSITIEGRPPLPHRRTMTKDVPRVSFAAGTKPPPVDDVLQGEHLLDEPLWREADTPAMIRANNNIDRTKASNPLIPRPAPVAIHKRRNTGGTIFVKSTMENPDIKATVKCVCGVYRAHIVQSQTSRPPLPAHLHKINLRVFRDEFPSRRHTPPSVPALGEIEYFYLKFFEKSQMEHDTIIMSLIYAERLIKETNGAVTPTPETWASILFSCMILASKVWDDLSMWNVDFSHVSLSAGMAPFSLRRINELEFAILTCLNFNVKVQASEYAKYYFLIRTMLSRSGLLEFGSTPLNKDDIKKLEIRTSRYQDANFHFTSERIRARSWDMTCDADSPNIGQLMKDQACLEQLVSMNH